jgi:WD40 repeat protein
MNTRVFKRLALLLVLFPLFNVDLSSHAQSKKFLLVATIDTNPIIYVAWSPDEKRILSVSENDPSLYVWNTETYQLDFMIERKGLAPLKLAEWSPDSQSIVGVTVSGIGFIWNASAPQEKADDFDIYPDNQVPMDYGGGFPNAIDWNTSGDKIAYAMNGVVIYDVSKQTLLGIYPEEPDHLTSGLVWLPRSDQIMTLNYNDEMMLVDVPTRKIVYITDLWTQYGERWENAEDYSLIYHQSITVSPDGKKVAVAGNYLTYFRRFVIFIRDVATGENIAILPADTNPVYTVQWSPVEDLIATGGEQGYLHLWTSQSEKSEQILVGHTDIVTSLSWSPDGSSLVSGSLDGTLKIWSRN